MAQLLTSTAFLAAAAFMGSGVLLADGCLAVLYEAYAGTCSV